MIVQKDTASDTGDRIILRVFAKGTFKLDSAAHLGSGEEGTTDMMLLLDTNGLPIIPGTSIAGAGRSYLAKRMFPWDKYIDQKRWDDLKLFGYKKGGHLTQSPLYVSDATVVDDTVSIAIRDGVRLDRKIGVADDKAKFDYEVIEAGTEFKINLQLTIRESDPKDELTQQFYALLEGFKKGEIRLGKRTSRGLGRGTVNEWEIAQLDMSQEKDILAWLKDEIDESLWKKKDSSYESTLKDLRSFFKITADFNLRSSMMIRQNLIDSKDMDKDLDVDMIHLCSKGSPLAPGSSLAGALRTQVELIASTLWDSAEEVSLVLNEMFGPVHSEDKPSDLWKSRLTVEETFIENGKPAKKERVAIDRFTGGSLEHAKFNEAPVEGESKDKKAKLRLTITLENPQDCEIGLLLLTLKDLWFGRCGIGGEASLGRGLLEGTRAKLLLKRYNETTGETNLQEWKLNDQFNLSDEEKAQQLKKFVKTAQNKPEQAYNAKYSRRSKEKEKR